MDVPKVNSRFTKEELNGATIEIAISSEPQIAGVRQIESWTHPEGDGIFVCVRGDVSFDHAPFGGGTTAMNWPSICFGQSLVDKIEKHPDQAIATFRLGS